MGLDFSQVMAIGSTTAVRQGADADRRNTGGGYARLSQEQEDHKRFSEICTYYQDNIKKSECLQMEILKGLQAGEDVSVLLLKACEAISLMTGNRLFFDQAKRDLGDQGEKKV